MKNKRKKAIGLIFTMLIILNIASIIYALPTQPTVTLVSNTTKGSGSGLEINYTGNTPTKAGGFIYTMNLEGISQNSRWKGFVGNVTGKLTLDDANDYTIYDWTVTTSISGEVYATRSSGTIDWTNINCSTINTTAAEEILMNHTANPSDNISRTFNGTNNTEFYVGNIKIHADSCPTTHLYINDSKQETYFQQILLYDGDKSYGNFTNFTSFENIVYTTIIEEDAFGYNNNVSIQNNSYDFQMILPEKGYSGWASSTAYYFFVELS